ncbi:MAG: BCAM0308 family protein [Thermodesulfobacteriota bacterium]
MDKGRGRRRDKLVKDGRKDAYREWGKQPDDTVCRRCHLVYHGGRWGWTNVTEKSHEALCPACQRIVDNYPAGIVALKGRFFEAHRDDILNLVRNEGRLEEGEHPLERIMDIWEGEQETVVKTTGIHGARRIGEAVSRAYRGHYDFTYGDSDKNIRVNWER